MNVDVIRLLITSHVMSDHYKRNILCWVDDIEFNGLNHHLSMKDESIESENFKKQVCLNWLWAW